MVKLHSNTAIDVQSIFNRIAPTYDSLNQWLSLGQHQIWKTLSVKWCQPKLNDIALDICCGSGDLTYLLAQKVGQKGRVYGLDFSTEQLKIAKDKNDSRNFQNINWIEGNALNLPFESNTFDCITMGYGLRNLPNIPKSLLEIQRVLKHGSKSAILDFHRPESAVISLFQNFYLDYLVVPIADSYGLREDYAYINKSLQKFPQGKEQVELGYLAGFSHAVHFPIAEGMMGVLVLTK